MVAGGKGLHFRFEFVIVRVLLAVKHPVLDEFVLGHDAQRHRNVLLRSYFTDKIAHFTHPYVDKADIEIHRNAQKADKEEYLKKGFHRFVAGAYNRRDLYYVREGYRRFGRGRLSADRSGTAVYGIT